MYKDKVTFCAATTHYALVYNILLNVNFIIVFFVHLKLIIKKLKCKGFLHAISSNFKLFQDYFVSN